MQTLAPRVVLIVCLLLLNGCASSSLFNAYPNQAQAFRQAAITGSAAPKNLEKKKTGADALLYLQESGRIEQINQQYSESQADFAAAMVIYQTIADRARVSASNLAAQGTSLFSNENAIPYQGAAYERIMVHQYQVFNFLAQGDLEAAMVETRRTANLQRQLELEHSAAIAKAAEESQKNHVSESDWADDDKIQNMRSFSNQVASSVLNAYSYYVSAILYEAQGDYNNALVDTRKALKIYPNSALLQKNLKQLTQAQDHGKTNNNATVVVLYEEGFVPSKQSFNISLPSWNFDTFFSIAIPYYATGDIPQPQPLKVRGGNLQSESENLVYFSALAVKHLEEAMPALILRQMLRAKSKYELQQQAAGVNELGGFLTMIYNIVSEQADLRSWLTLPNSAQAARLTLEPGTQTIELKQGSLLKSLELPLKPNSFTIIRVTRPGNSSTLLTEIINL